MRLINVETLQLCEIPKPDSDHPFAILSHTWGNDEVSFQELSAKTGTEKAGYSKIMQCCAKAELHEFKYVWIDTCCIDKTSSSELSEAINSMYQWYKKASVCYVYLSDVESDEGVPDEKSFKRSRWFTRGWTLQELIAPRDVVFFDRNWNDIGTKLSLRHEISDVTGVPVELLAGLKGAPLNGYCIAQRMSWAANRETTRDEDIAYCLMGMFDVNMPVLYGEGDKAFIRLQHEILKDSDDQSLFAWVHPETPEVYTGEGFDTDDSSDADETPDGNDIPETEESPDAMTLSKHLVNSSGLSEVLLKYLEEHSSILASSPAFFRYGKDIQRIETTGSQALPFEVTNKGLHISLPLIQTDTPVDLYASEDSDTEDPTDWLQVAMLDCKVRDEDMRLAIVLAQQPSGRYIRVAAHYLYYDSDNPEQKGGKLPEPRELYICTSISDPSPAPEPTLTQVIRPVMKLTTNNCTVLKCESAYCSHDAQRGDPTPLFVLRVKSSATGLGDALVVLATGPDDVGISCSVCQPSISASFDQAILEWWAQQKEEHNGDTLHHIGTDRAALRLRNGDKIVVSVNIGLDPRFCVVIEWTDQQLNQSPIARALPVPEKQERDTQAKSEKQRKYESKWSSWTIFSREIFALRTNRHDGYIHLK